MFLILYKNFPINDYANQVYMKSETHRDATFDSYEHITVDNLSSNDKSKRTIRIPLNYYHGNMYNYGCIVEANKRYYIFITAVEWSSNLSMCTLHYQYDYWQTYCYRITFKESFVEREHVADDTYGKHIIDESLPVDEYITQNSTVLNGGNNGMYFCLCVSDASEVLSQSANGYVALPSTSKPSAYEYSTLILLSKSLDTINLIIQYLTVANKVDGINGLYLVPFCAISDDMLNACYFTDTGEPAGAYIGVKNSLPSMNTASINRPSTIDGYAPLNNKCFTYPYCFVNFTNNNGNAIQGQFELSNNKNLVTFDYYFPCTEGNTSYGYLSDYNGVSKNFDYSLQGQTNVELPYVTNTFAAYMSANQNAIANQYASIDRNSKYSLAKSAINTTVGVGASLAVGNYMGAFNSALSGAESAGDTLLNSYNQLQNINASLKDVQSKADVAHGSYTGIASIISGQIGFKSQLITVTRENIEMIDKFFTMFGYKVNTIKIPQFTSRTYWNYVKTSGINLIGNVPQDALNVIKQMFDSGTTIWHNPEYMYKYGELERGNRA